MKYLLLFLLLPALATAQEQKEVEPVVSDDYLRLLPKHAADSLLYPRPRPVIYEHYWGNQIRSVTVGARMVLVSPFLPRQLSLGGTYRTEMSLQTINQLPALQQAFVQGRSLDGRLTWQGPETGELFSYGPALSSLEFDGTRYRYDQQGKLVPAGTGNGQPAIAYNNNIFRTAVRFNQSLRLHSTVRRYDQEQWYFLLDLSHTANQIVIQDNSNLSKSLSASAKRSFSWGSLTGAYQYLGEKYANPNRNGFLNRVYQQSLLTPVSFDNSQGNYTFTGTLRSYSDKADNPHFLLEENNNRFNRTQQNASLTLDKFKNPLKFKLIPSFEKIQERSIEYYPPGAAGFPTGRSTRRDKDDINYSLRSQLLYNFKGNNQWVAPAAEVNYNYTSALTTIHYTHPDLTYQYQRSAHDLSAGFSIIHRENRHIDERLDIGNRFYFSNTSHQQQYFLPYIQTGVTFKDLFHYPHDLTIKIDAGLHHFNSELPVHQSFSYAQLFRHHPVQFNRYFPVQEAKEFDGLAPVQHQEWTGKIAVDYHQLLILRASFVLRNTQRDIFPVYERDQLLLKNIAQHQHRGLDLQLGITKNMVGDLWMSHNLSLYTYRDQVQQVENGYAYTPLAGFSNVYKALVPGQPMGVIIGNTYARDAQNNILIDETGFPMVNDAPAIIGNPTPDFILKLDNTIYFENWSLHATWEWKKGGDIWNGTQAALDYYGRSAVTAAERNTTGYIFPGVLEDGQPNNIPVSFYNPARPVTQNRWTRYGISGVAADYIQRADHLRLNDISLSHRFNWQRTGRQLTISAFLRNVMLWTAYEGVDPNQLLFDQPNSTGLDFFNLPAAKTYGLSFSFQF
ncbi:hypothetical protein [Chitinophaga nivalis]|uniref:TonB-dependent receptor-like beta-barrel domain-containing protein n=1 Tax=Chitinophaga nivalis TaxID=2991709 RepID=A0ABT3IQU4_9BACT|nr:hypothetical protein [Chitinophaga nivalis]MCW3463981.1 hypothetical protein [Chitinophaga nivalis]MCW3486329.1 hypothetical protein [Chitinophaga nivalis]